MGYVTYLPNLLRKLHSTHNQRHPSLERGAATANAVAGLSDCVTVVWKENCPEINKHTLLFAANKLKWSAVEI